MKQSARNHQLKIEHRQKEHSPSAYRRNIDCFIASLELFVLLSGKLPCN